MLELGLSAGIQVAGYPVHKIFDSKKRCLDKILNETDNIPANIIDFWSVGYSTDRCDFVSIKSLSRLKINKNDYKINLSMTISCKLLMNKLAKIRIIDIFGNETILSKNIGVLL